MVYVVTGLDAFFIRNDVLGSRQVTSFQTWPPDRLVEAAYASNGAWSRFPSALNAKGQYAPVTLGGHRVGYMMGWWPRKMPLSDKTAQTHVAALEDVAVYLHTRNHSAAREVVRNSAYARHLLTRKWD